MSGVPVRISEELAEEAKSQATLKGRSITSQVEFWSNIGKRVESSLTGEELDRILGGDDIKIEVKENLSMAAIREKVKADKSPVSSLTNAEEWFVAAPGRKGFVIKVNKKGERVTGKFKHGKFSPEN